MERLLKAVPWNRTTSAVSSWRCNCSGTEVMVFDLFQGAGKVQPFSRTKGRALAGCLHLPSAGHKTATSDGRWQKMGSKGIWDENGDSRVGGEGSQSLFVS